MCHDNEEWCKIWRGLTSHFKIDIGSLMNFDPKHLKVSKNFILMCSFWEKYILFELKKYREVVFHDTEEWCKIWRKTDLWFGKWHEEFGKFSPEQTKVSKLGLLLGPFIQSRKCMSLKFTGELCVMTMKNDAKFEEELTCQFKTDMRNLTNFDLSTRKYQKICTLTGCFWPKYIMFDLSKYRGVMSLMALKIDSKFEGKLPCASKKGMRNLANFHQSTWKSQNWDLDGILLSKVENVWA